MGIYIILKLNSCRGAGSPEQRVGKHGRNDAYMPCKSALPVSCLQITLGVPPAESYSVYKWAPAAYIVAKLLMRIWWNW